MKITRTGLLIPGDLEGYRGEAEEYNHDWLRDPLYVSGKRKRIVAFRPIGGGSRQYFSELMAPVMEADASSIAGTAEAGLWPVSPWTAMVANQLQPGQLWKLEAHGVMSTAATTPGTLQITPRWGTSSSGTSFGASGTSGTLTASLTNVPWNLRLLLMNRTIGSAGQAVLSGVFECDQAGIPTLCFGGPVTTLDTTTPQGLWLGATLGAAGDTMTTRIVALWCEN